MTTPHTTPAARRGVSQEDLFGNPVDPVAESTGGAGRRAGGEASRAPDPVNDMTLVQTVLGDIADDTTVLHVDDHGHVRRCIHRDGAHHADAVSGDLASVVAQLLAAQYLTTRRAGSCPARTVEHGPVIAMTATGKNAVHRWRAYRRPTTWPTTRPATAPTTAPAAAPLAGPATDEGTR